MSEKKVKKTGEKVGYARVSSTDQNTDIQVKQLEDAGCDRVFHEQLSGKTRNRPQLIVALDYVRDGDTFVVTRLDRLARSLRDLKNIVYDLEQRGVGFQATEQEIDTSTSAGKLFLNMVASFAEFETDLRSERQREGIEAAKKKGKYAGRPKSLELDVDDILHKVALKVPIAAIAREAGCSRTSIYNVIEEHEGKVPCNT